MVTILRLSGNIAVDADRFVQSHGADFDKARPSFRLQYVNPANDQDFAPFVSYVPRVNYSPTFANPFANRQDINLGVSKAFQSDTTPCVWTRAAIRRPRPSGRSASPRSTGGGSGTRRPLRTRCSAPVKEPCFSADRPLISWPTWKDWSNAPSGTFTQVVAGAAIKAGWRF